MHNSGKWDLWLMGLAFQLVHGRKVSIACRDYEHAKKVTKIIQKSAMMKKPIGLISTDESTFSLACDAPKPCVIVWPKKSRKERGNGC